jgi:uncharacterized RDD family membrane protein YckC
MVDKATIIKMNLPAGFISRLEAFLIDLIIVAVASLGAIRFFELIYHFFLIYRIWPDLENWPYAPVISSLVVVVYFIYFWSFIGSTPGKLLLGLQIVRRDGSDLSLGRSFVRFFGYWVSAIPLFFGFIWILVDQGHQGWHDKMADTHVIYTHTRITRVVRP